MCSTLDPCSVGICGGYDLTPGCDEFCTALPVVCNDMTEILPGSPGPHGITTPFEMNIDVSSNPRADVTIDWGD